MTLSQRMNAGTFTLAAGVCLTMGSLAGCGGGHSAAPASPQVSTPTSSTPTPTASETQADLGLVVLNDCLASQPSWAEVPCGDARAVAKVVGLGMVTNPYGTGSAQSDCPAETDDVLNRPDGGSGYFCLRNLRPPHHSQPGSGGGVIVVGDCLVKHSANYVEVPCKGSGQHPEYKVLDITDWKHAPCPKGEGRVQLSPDRLGMKFYCAERL
ncbi:hypothetical protein [Actinomadura rupiterrae]|uniref:hypothetical protein n=1 Tax=Actinomadura rupiterrae TaxID=559627 RepID=UPI0020A2A21E|nr:hypothetical protein [Actinomadura rupiterrae]MCP2338924.1 hypothetical protein [Actinomadura rupiterrae]